eukprot:9133664-Ditylum_brightwellii.AAC.1
MGQQYFIVFLNYYLSGSDKENILQYNLFLTLRCDEMTAQLCVAAILHIAIVIPIRWLSEADGSKGLDEDYMMNIFSSLGDILPQFKKYLKYMFEEKESNIIDSCSKEDHVLAIDGAVAELFYPTRLENHQTTP